MLRSYAFRLPAAGVEAMYALTSSFSRRCGVHSSALDAHFLLAHHGFAKLTSSSWMLDELPVRLLLPSRGIVIISHLPAWPSARDAGLLQGLIHWHDLLHRLGFRDAAFPCLLLMTMAEVAILQWVRATAAMELRFAPKLCSAYLPL